MRKRAMILIAGMLCCLVAVAAHAQGRGHIVIDDYPKVVKAGEPVDVVVAWNSVPVKKGYVLRLQLENWDVEPGICVVQDEEKYSSVGSVVMSMKVPGNTPSAKGCRFIAAFLSKSDGWDDVLTVSSTSKDVSIEALLTIERYSDVVKAGQEAYVDLSWRDIPVNGEYKLVVQLENWDVKPGICEVKTLDSFKSDDSKEVRVLVPGSIRSAAGCRFVAAFISKKKGWDDVYTIATSEKTVKIVNDQE